MEDRTMVFACPHCNQNTRPVLKYDGERIVKCANCGSYIKYEPENDDYRVIRKPERTTSSGIRFY